MIKKVICAAMLAASIGGVAVPANAAVIVRVAPPALRVEEAPAPRPGYVWGAGHWEWRHGRHEWVGGTWIRERRGYHYSQPTWQQRHGGWEMQRGGWKRGDRDGDGVPNGEDRHPDNPHRD